MELLKGMGIRLLGSVVNGVPLKADRRIAKLHKNNAKKPRKIAASKASSNAKPANAAKAEAKVEEPIVESDVATADLDDVDLTDDIEIDFDDLGLDENKD